MSSKTIILYQSRYGTTEKAAKLLAEKLYDEVEIINLKNNKNPSIDEYSNIIIGGSIRAAMIQSGIKKYIEKNMPVLLTKKVGLFLCCMEEGEKAEKQFQESFPEELRTKALVTGFFGGEFDFERMNFLEKSIIKKVSGVTEPLCNIKHQAIEDFAAGFNN